MKTTIFTILATLTISISFSQTKQSNWWYFGNKCGLNFNKMVSGLPTSVANGSINTIEGSSSISDKNGNLLFYTDGIKVWDKNHARMTNGFGLFGNSSSTNSAVIVPFPGNTNKYYIITSDAIGLANKGVNYTEIDMSLRSGLGDVVASKKNIKLFKPACERIVVAKNLNGGYWLIAQQDTLNKYNAYSISSSGISSTPIVSTIGPAVGNLNGLGYMKVSPKGNKIGSCWYFTSGKVLLFDFDPKTGKLTNYKLDSVGGSFYGLEFSPDGSKLYVSEFGSKVIRQYNANAVSNHLFNQSKKNISAKGVNGIRSLQVGPDKKIYLTTLKSSRLSVIKNPNASGAACNLDSAGPIIPSGGRIHLGLPTFPVTFYVEKSLIHTGFCSNAATKFSLSDTSGVDSVLVNFGDTSSGIWNWTKILPDTHSYAKDGNYSITAFVFSNDSGKLIVDTIKESIQISTTPYVKLGNDTILCKFDSVEVIVNSDIGYFLYWNDSLKTKKRQIERAGKYWAVASNACGVSSDTILIKQIFHDSLELGNDTVFCVGDSVKLEVKDRLSKYLWNNGDTGFSISEKQSSLIWVEKKNVCGVFRDSVRIEQISAPQVNLGNDTSLCIGRFVVFDADSSAYSQYYWSTGSRNQLITVSRAGYYSVNVVNKCGSAKDTVNLTTEDHLIVKLRSDTSFCQGDSLKLAASTNLPNYKWSTSSTDSSIWVSQSGTYRLTSTNRCGSFIDEVVILVNQPIIPSITRNADTLISSPAKTYQWYSSGVIIPNETKEEYTLITTGKFKVYTTDSNDCKAESTVSEIEVIYSDTGDIVESVWNTEMVNWNVKLFPNPANERLNIQFKGVGRGLYSLEIFDVAGSKIYSSKFEINQELKTESISLLGFAKGKYMVRISNKESFQTFRLIKIE